MRHRFNAGVSFLCKFGVNGIDNPKMIWYNKFIKRPQHVRVAQSVEQ